MMLVDEGKLRLSDPASKYLPEFKNVMVQDGGTDAPRPPSREITDPGSAAAHLGPEPSHLGALSATAGALAQRSACRSSSINITKAPLLEDPGTRFRYSEATTVLGRIVEVVSGKSFDAFVTERILQPLGMNDTTFWVEGDARRRLATVYQRAPGWHRSRRFEIEEVPFTEKPALMEGAVGLVSTAGDFLRFSQMLLNKGELDGVRLLTADTAGSMTMNALVGADPARRAAAPSAGDSATSTWWSAPGSRGYLTTIGEYGWDGSAGTFFAVDPSRELVVTLMTQNLPANPDGLRQKFKAAVLQSIVD